MATLEKEFSKFSSYVTYPFILIVILWICHFYNEYHNHIYNTWGIYPRAIDGLKGIFASPLLHSDWNHLISNSVPMFVLTTLMVIFYRRVALASFIIIYILVGLAVWLFAREVYHIGASGVVYGLVSFVLWSGIFRKNTRSIVLSLVIVILYSGYLAGIIPGKEGISWESHLFGAIIGVFVAYVFKDILAPDEIELDPWLDEDDSKRTFYLPRDIFAKTKRERAQELLDARREQEGLGGWEQNSTENY